MQLIHRNSLYVLLALLSLSFLTVFYGNTKDLSRPNLVSNVDYLPEPPRLFSPSVEPGLYTRIFPFTPTSTAPDTVWAKLSGDLKLDHQTQAPQVKAEIRHILANRAEFNHILKAAAPYIYFIHKQTQARKLPAELALIPVIESQFNPNDHSTRGALGLWQLMPGTAHALGLTNEGRRNVVASTNAALAYFNDLGKFFKGNWYLAIAAYDVGQGRIHSAVKHAGSSVFWNLSLPKETKVYVPKLLAVAAIIKNPEKYGVKLPGIMNQPYFAELKVKKPVNLTHIAKTTGVDMKVLTALNPDHAATHAKNSGYSVLVPINKASSVKAQLGNTIVA